MKALCTIPLALLLSAPLSAQTASLDAFATGPVFEDFGPHSPVEGATPRHPELVSGSIISAASRQGRKAQTTSQIPPSRVTFCDQIDLPLPSPVFDLLFTHDRLVHGAKHLKMDEHFGVVALGKTVGSSIPVLGNPSHQVGCDAGVDRFAKTACHEVGARLKDAFHIAHFARRWTLKQVQGDEFGVVGVL